jgi:hypothetical protein
LKHDSLPLLPAALAQVAGDTVIVGNDGAANFAAVLKVNPRSMAHVRIAVSVYVPFVQSATIPAVEFTDKPIILKYR